MKLCGCIFFLALVLWGPGCQDSGKAPGCTGKDCLADGAGSGVGADGSGAKGDAAAPGDAAASGDAGTPSCEIFCGCMVGKCLQPGDGKTRQLCMAMCLTLSPAHLSCRTQECKLADTGESIHCMYAQGQGGPCN